MKKAKEKFKTETKTEKHETIAVEIITVEPTSHHKTGPHIGHMHPGPSNNAITEEPWQLHRGDEVDFFHRD